MSRVDRRKRKVRLWAAMGIIACTAVIFFADIMKKDTEFSENENRMLASRPEPAGGMVMDGRFMKRYESYKSDQFIGRDIWMNVKTFTDLTLGKKDSNGVFKGADGYLLEDIRSLEKESYEANMDAVASFRERYADLGMYMMIVPNAANILSDKLPRFAVTEDQDAQLSDAGARAADAGVEWLDASAALRGHKDEEIYYRTDHHWTTKGAYYTFLETADALGIAGENRTEFVPYPVTDDFNGTLSSVSGYDRERREKIEIYLPQDDTETVVSYVDEKEKSASLYDSGKLQEKDKYGMFLNGNHGLVEIKTTSAEQRRLLIFKDSYANCFVPFLAPYYREIVLVDPRYYYGKLDELMVDSGITDVLFLYNANTFFADNNLSGVLNGE